MANKKLQLDRKKADLDKDGKLSKYEEAKGEAIQKAMDDDEIPEMAHGGMVGDCGLMSGPRPIGASENEVARTETHHGQAIRGRDGPYDDLRNRINSRG